MSRKWYAVQHGNNFDSDCGSTVKRDALRIANRKHRDYPGEEIRICICRVDNDFCKEELIIFPGTR